MSEARDRTHILTGANPRSYNRKSSRCIFTKCDPIPTQFHPPTPPTLPTSHTHPHTPPVSKARGERTGQILEDAALTLEGSLVQRCAREPVGPGGKGLQGWGWGCGWGAGPAARKSPEGGGREQEPRVPKLRLQPTHVTGQGRGLRRARPRSPALALYLQVSSLPLSSSPRLAPFPGADRHRPTPRRARPRGQQLRRRGTGPGPPRGPECGCGTPRGVASSQRPRCRPRVPSPHTALPTIPRRPEKQVTSGGTGGEFPLETQNLLEAQL